MRTNKTEGGKNEEVNAGPHNSGNGDVLLGSAEAFTNALPGMSMQVSASIVSVCTASTLPLDFGTSTGPVSQRVNTFITVNCSNGTSYRIDIDAGLNYLPGTRRLKTGTAPVSASNSFVYWLYKNQAGSIRWGDNGATFCTTCTPIPTGLSATGTGADQAHTVYGIRAGGSNAPGVYTDTVTVTVNY